MLLLPLKMLHTKAFLINGAVGEGTWLSPGILCFALVMRRQRQRGGLTVSLPLLGSKAFGLTPCCAAQSGSMTLSSLPFGQQQNHPCQVPDDFTITSTHPAPLLCRAEIFGPAAYVGGRVNTAQAQEWRKGDCAGVCTCSPCITLARFTKTPCIQVF